MEALLAMQEMNCQLIYGNVALEDSITYADWLSGNWMLINSDNLTAPKCSLY